MNAALDTDVGRELLGDLGFLLVRGRPFAEGPAYLFVGLRSRPTLRHFDPERIDLWQTSAGHGLPATIDWSTREQPAAEYSWGPIRVVDRVNASNEFASFGGSLLVARVDGLKVVVFCSDAPILGCGGHSQDWDFGSREVTGFQARLRAAADPHGALEAEIAGLSANARYAAFVADGLARIKARESTFGWTRADRLVLERERRRLQSARHADWDAGLSLAERIGGR